MLGRSWSEQKCAFGALLRPRQQTYCADLKVDNGGNGHFQAKAVVPCLTSFGGFMPDQSEALEPIIQLLQALSTLACDKFS
jgi:hypothetical protein